MTLKEGMSLKGKRHHVNQEGIKKSKKNTHIQVELERKRERDTGDPQRELP